jgi:drug/metabolite transporter (DMT)-like permease
MHRGPLLIVTSALAFSAMTVMVKLAGQRLPTQEIVVARALVSLILSWGLLRRAGVSPWGQDRVWLWIRGGLGFAGLSCVYAAVAHLPLADATVLQFLYPPITALLAGLFLHETLSRRLLGATLMSLVGVVLVARPASVFGSVAKAPPDPVWVAVAIAGAIFTASAYVVVRRLGRTEDPLVIVFYFPLVTLPAALPTMGLDFVRPVGLEWVWLLGIGLATQVGQVCLTRGLSVMPASQGTALSYLQVVFAVFWGMLVFAEVPDVLTIAGGALIIGSSIWVARSTARSPAIS